MFHCCASRWNHAFKNQITALQTQAKDKHVRHYFRCVHAHVSFVFLTLKPEQRLAKHTHTYTHTHMHAHTHTHTHTCTHTHTHTHMHTYTQIVCVCVYMLLLVIVWQFWYYLCILYTSCFFLHWQNPKKAEVQANLNLFLETASGFYLQVRLADFCFYLQVKFAGDFCF